MQDTFYIRLVVAPCPEKLGKLMEMRSLDILCTKEGQELMKGLDAIQHGPIYAEHFYEYKRSLCDANIFHMFHGPELLQFAENYFFIDEKKYAQARALLPETVRILDLSSCTVL